jgi:hypothetical protein
VVTGNGPMAPQHRAIDAAWVTDQFRDARQEAFPQSLPWAVAGQNLHRKAEQIAGFLQSNPDAIPDVRPTMLMALRRAAGSQDPEDQKVPVVFGTWVSQFTDLREEHRGLRRPAARAPAAPSAPHVCAWHRGGKNRDREARQTDDACEHCRHAKSFSRPRPAAEPTGFTPPEDPRTTWPTKAAGGNT